MRFYEYAIPFNIPSKESFEVECFASVENDNDKAMTMTMCMCVCERLEREKWNEQNDSNEE